MASRSVRYGDLLRASHRRAIRSARGSARTAIGLNDPQIVSRSARTARLDQPSSARQIAHRSVGWQEAFDRGYHGLDPCKRFAHCRHVSRPFIKIIVTYVDAELATGFHHELRTKADARRSCLSDLAQAPPHHPCQTLRKGSGVSWKLAIQNPRFVEQQVRSVLPKRGVVLAC